MIESFGEKLKRLLEEKGMSQRQLAIRSGIEREYINQIIKGKVKKPGLDKTQKIAEGLGESPLVFFDGEVRSPKDALLDIQVTIESMIPVYAEVSAGPGIEPVDWLAITRKPAPENLIALRVKGLCLEPEIQDGDTLIVDKELQPRNGDLVVVIIDGQASVKRYRERLPDRIGEKNSPTSWLENSQGTYRPEEVHQVGVVVEFSRKRR